jgi:hypothetical protein
MVKKKKKKLLDQIKTRYWIIISSKAITITVDIPLLTRFTDKIDSRMGWDGMTSASDKIFQF